MKFGMQVLGMYVDILGGFFFLLKANRKCTCISDGDTGASVYKIKMRNVCLEIILELLKDPSSGSNV